MCSSDLLFRRRNKNSMASFARRAGKNRNLLEEVKRISESLIFENGSERKPPAIVPGAGPEGNINGSQFPPRTWALTFDDGPHETFTPQILANLGKLGKHVSFFWLIECLEKNPLLPRKAMELGHALENHSWSHENLDKADPQTLYKEIVKSSERDPDFYGEKPLFFRLPYGAGLSNKTVRQMIAEQKMVHVFWNVDSLDWKDKDPNSILERVKKEMALAKRGIVLFHDIHPQSVEASNLLLRWSDSLAGSPEAHRWVKIPEIVDELNRQKKSPLTTSPGAAHPDQK